MMVMVMMLLRMAMLQLLVVLLLLMGLLLLAWLLMLALLLPMVVLLVLAWLLLLLMWHAHGMLLPCIDQHDLDLTQHCVIVSPISLMVMVASHSLIATLDTMPIFLIAITTTRLLIISSHSFMTAMLLVTLLATLCTTTPTNFHRQKLRTNGPDTAWRITASVHFHHALTAPIHLTLLLFCPG